MDTQRAVKVRSATNHDVLAIAGMLVDAFWEFEPEYTPAAYSGTILTPETIARRIEREETLVAAIDEVIVETVSLQQAASITKVRSMAIVPSARGRGIALALLREVERRVVHVIAEASGQQRRHS